MHRNETAPASASSSTGPGRVRRRPAGARPEGLRRAGQAQPLASSLNWAPGQTVANAVTVKVGAAGKVSVSNPVGSAHVIVDIVGYYDDLPGGDG